MKILGAFGKRESENDVVCITLQVLQFKWKKVNIPKVKGDGTDLMSIFYANPNNRETFLNLTLCRTRGKQQHMCQFLSCCLKSLAQYIVMKKKCHESFTEL